MNITVPPTETTEVPTHSFTEIVSAHLLMLTLISVLQLEIAIYSICLCIGGPLNIVSFIKLWKNFRAPQTAASRTAAQITLLRLNLNIADLSMYWCKRYLNNICAKFTVTMFIYTTSQIGWLATYQVSKKAKEDSNFTVSWVKNDSLILRQQLAVVRRRFAMQTVQVLPLFWLLCEQLRCRLHSDRSSVRYIQFELRQSVSTFIWAVSLHVAGHMDISICSQYAAGVRLSSIRAAWYAQLQAMYVTSFAWCAQTIAL